MISDLSVIKLKAIGIVRNEVKKAPGSGYEWEKVISNIEVDISLADALDNLEEFSHIIVFYWMHESPGFSRIKVHPKGKRQIPLKGVFATRSPDRPNSLGKSNARLLQRRGNILTVEGLDAIDGTPIIDIKPYISGYDSVKNAKVPSWSKHQ